jgi:hypothetical protein
MAKIWAKKPWWHGVYLKKDKGQKLKDPTMIHVKDLEGTIDFYLERQPELEVRRDPDDPDTVRVGFFYD